MDSNRSPTLLAAGYPVATVLAAASLYDLAMRLRPYRPDDVTWRIGAVGTTSLQLPTLLLALAMIALTALMLQHRRFLRVLSCFSLAAAGITLLLMPLFALDVLQLRNLVAADAKLTIDLTMGRAALTALLTVLSLAWIGVGGWRATVLGRQTVASKTRSSSSMGLLGMAGRMSTRAAATNGGSELPTSVKRS